MKATITYCIMCNYNSDAERVSDELKFKGIKVDLIKGSNGIFNVDIDGKVVYSRHTTGRFPNQGELLMLI